MSAMDWITVAATLAGMAFGAGIAWGLSQANILSHRRRFDAIEQQIIRIESRLDGLYNGRSNSNH